jgi:hypothetical protein
VGEREPAGGACPEFVTGLSLVVASQQPAALDMEVLSHDAIISHALAMGEDKTALTRRG